ncbi:MAG TPA: DUF1559 domain-containing protein [Chthonomonadaceae bacterium]|nr:DUF1559 domain-containing protein [Chthonomonadaceae bacterium]
MKRNIAKGFTLIELLVVIAIIAILAAILFPVFAQARERARAISCVSNLKQMGLAAVMYAQDYDENYPGMWQWSPGAIMAHSPYLYPPGWTAEQAKAQCETCPYVKNTDVYACPSRKNTSYGDPALYFSYGYAYPTMWGGYPPIPGSAFGFPVGPSLAAFSEPADTVMIMDSGAWPGTDDCNALTFEGIYNYACSPANTSGAQYSYPYVYEPTSNRWSAPLPLHLKKVNIAFVDGHVKPMSPEATIRPKNLWCQIRNATDPTQCDK